MIVEVFGGYISNSVAIMSDAAHLLSDLLAFFVGILALRLATKGVSAQYTFGYHRAETIGASMSIIIIWILTVALLIMAVYRFFYPPTDFNPTVMMITALLGIVVNIIMGFTLHQGTQKHLHSHVGGGSCSHGNSHGHSHGHAHGSTTNGHTHRELKVMEEPTKRPKHNRSKSLGLHCDKNFDNNEHHHHHQRGAERAMDCCNLEDCSLLSSAEEEHKHEEQRQGSVHSHNHSHGENNHDHKNHDHEDNADSNHSHEHESAVNVNIRAAFLHILGDLVQSVGVFFAAVIIYFKPEWVWFDPFCTVLFSVIVFWTTIPISKECIEILMEGTPEITDVINLRKQLESTPGVKEVYELRVWSISESKTALAVKVVANKESRRLLSRLKKVCRSNKVFDSTIQIDSESSNL